MAAEVNTTHEKSRKRRRISLYDAVAGRVGYEGFLTEPKPSKYRDTASTSTTAVAPEEVLFRRKRAPQRYEENDFYFANHHLTPSQQLPDSDLLKTIHAYVSDYYAATTQGGRGRIDFRSMDETALLAMGILLEEAAAEAIGKTGHLALVEREDSPASADSGSSG